MKFPKLKNALLCRILVYAVVLGGFIAPIILVANLKVVPEAVKVIVGIGLIVVLLIYLIMEQSTGKSQAVKELLKLMERNRDQLHNSMTAEQRETLEKYDDCINEMHSIMELEIFSYAFRLGGRLMLATLMDSGEDA